MTSLGGILFLGLCFAIPVAIVAVVIFLGIQRTRIDTTSEAQYRMSEEARSWLDQQAPSLLPWGTESLYDISDVKQSKYISTSTTKTWGTVKAVHSDEPILAFYAIHSWNKRSMFVRSSQDTWHMAWDGDTIVMTFNGERWGTWTEDGTLRDASDTPVGTADRLYVTTMNALPTMTGRRYDVVIDGRYVGRIMAHRGLNRTNVLTGTFKKQPVVTMEDVEPDANAKRWLFALASVEVSPFNEVKITTSPRS